MDQGSSGQATLDGQDPAILAAINGGPSTGAGSLFPMQDAAGNFIADPSNLSGGSSIGGVFAAVPWWAWAGLAAVIVLRLVK
jgi:hypothetical protein